MINGKQVLLVDDDDTLLEILGEQLQLHEEFRTVAVGTGTKALELARVDFFDAILLGVGLSDMDGHEVCRLMRLNGVTSPIIMLSGKDSDSDANLGIGSGANDFITKPFRLGALLARLRAHIHQHERSNDVVYTIGSFTFNPSTKFLVNNEDAKKIRLTDKETAILKYLYRAGERVVGRDILLDKVWGYNMDVESHTLETHVYGLRQKIEPDPSNARILLTEPGGYRLVP
jgi:DNA-binding response OmpR family regulator